MLHTINISSLLITINTKECVKFKIDFFSRRKSLSILKKVKGRGEVKKGKKEKRKKIEGHIFQG